MRTGGGGTRALFTQRHQWALALVGMVFCFMSGPSGLADSVQLVNGTVLQGRVVEQTAEHVILEMDADGDGEDAIRMEIPRGRIVPGGVTITRGFMAGSQRGPVVRDITPVEPTPKPEPQETTEDGEEEDADDGFNLFGPDEDEDEDTAEEEGDDEGTEENAEDAPAEMPPGIRDAVIGLGSDDEEVRAQAQQFLISRGRKATPYLVGTLDEVERPMQVNAILLTLGDIQDRRAVQALITEMGKGAITEWERREWAWLALKNTTGEDLPFNSRATDTIRKAQIEDWQEWFNNNQDQYPEQIVATDVSVPLGEGSAPPPEPAQGREGEPID